MSNQEENIDTITENEEPAQEEVVQVPMVPYTVFDVDGHAVRHGMCPQNLVEHQAFGEGETVMEGEHDSMCQHDEPHVRHSFARQAHYPSIGDQLDVLWKIVAAVPAFQIPEAVAMLERIQAAKDVAPKGKVFTHDGESFVEIEKK